MTYRHSKGTPVSKLRRDLRYLLNGEMCGGALPEGHLTFRFLYLSGFPVCRFLCGCHCDSQGVAFGHLESVADYDGVATDAGIFSSFS